MMNRVSVVGESYTLLDVVGILHVVKVSGVSHLDGHVVDVSGIHLRAVDVMSSITLIDVIRILFIAVIKLNLLNTLPEVLDRLDLPRLLFDLRGWDVLDLTGCCTNNRKI